MKFMVVLCSLLLLCGCAQNPAPAETPDADEPPAQTPTEDPNFSQLDPPAVGEEYAVITTALGTIELRLFPAYAPKAVENFKTLAKDGYYDGMVFHRIVKDFVIQTGDPTGTGMGGDSKWGEGFEIEPHPQLRHYNGALGMARNPNDTSSNRSQFYIVQNSSLAESLVQEFNYIKENPDELLQEGYDVTLGDMFPADVIDIYLEHGGVPSLDFGYTVFGQVISGFDVVEAIGGTPTGENDKPTSDVVMNKVEIKTYGK